MGTAQASDWLENFIVDHVFRSRTFPKPTALYVALFTAAPSDAGGGTEVVGGVGYARVNCPPLDTNWTATQGGTSGNSSGTSGVTSNAVAVAFGTPSGAWGNITHFGLFDAATGGNLVVWDALLAPRNILSGDPAPSFPPGSLQITVG